MIEKVYKITFWCFLIESMLIIIGISMGFISYGIGIGTPFMQIGIIVGLIAGGLLRLVLRKLDTTTKVVFATLLSFIFVFLCFYYILEDHFKLILN